MIDITEEAIARLDAEFGNGASSLGPAEPSPALRPSPRMLQPVPGGDGAGTGGD
ncbi:hypothetical protein [Mangrovicoccus ximenensis]|uniref:hypothetical protein n=1 Tax=Mangrovicoccus ximenensis TaxID=1911570 RepID=UPI001374B03C|nr:hypothetical protein [Mangrovicoccus ximenensis]